MAQQPLVGQSLLIIKASQSYLETPDSVRLLWISDHPDAETCIWQHTTLTRDRDACPWLDSNPRSQEARGFRPTPLDRAATRFGTFELPTLLYGNPIYLYVFLFYQITLKHRRIDVSVILSGSVVAVAT
jgi:hypothetical protein